LIDIILGIASGIVTGVFPGLHINLFVPILLNADRSVIPFLVAVSISHSFFSFIPSIFLGIPEESTALSILPSHRMALRSEALKAFKLTVIGGILSSLIVISLLPFLTFFFSFYAVIKQFVPVAIVGLILLMFLSSNRKAYFISLFVMSAVLGTISLEKMPNALFPLFSGFFGMSSVLYSIIFGSASPAQRPDVCIENIPIKSSFFGAFSGLLCGFLPGVSSSIGALFSEKFGAIHSDEDYLAMIGGTTTVYAFISILSIYLIGRPRSAVAIVIDGFSNKNILYLTGLILISIGLSGFFAWVFSKHIILLMNKLSTELLNTISLVFILFMVLWFCGINGMIVLMASTAIGLMCIMTKTRRNTCMASLLIPVLLYYV